VLSEWWSGGSPLVFTIPARGSDHEQVAEEIAEAGAEGQVGRQAGGGQAVRQVGRRGKVGK